MKIELFTPNLKSIGGIQRYSEHLARALQDSGQEIEIVELKNASLTGKISFLIRAIWKTGFYGPDFIWITQIGLARAALRLKKVFKIPYILSVHGVEAWNLSFKEKEIVGGALKILPVSRFTKNKIISSMPETEKNMVVMPNVAEELPQSPFKMRQNLGISSEAKIILTVSRLSRSEQYKGYDKVVRIMPDILKELPQAIYVIAGDGDDRERIEKLIKELNLENKVILAGEVERGDLRSFYEECDIFAMPSKGEGFGIVFLEALTCGKAVVAGNKDGSVDALLGGELGILVDPDDLESIKNGILNALKNGAPLPPEVLKSKARGEYGYEKFKERVKSFINELQT